MQLTVLHFNENTDGIRKRSISGDPLYSVHYDKYKNVPTVNKVLEEATYGEDIEILCLLPIDNFHFA